MTASAKCISCGMPMRSKEEHAGGDPSKSYCHLCSTPDGNMKSRDEVHAGMVAFLQKSQDVEESVAKKMAMDMMRDLPAWKNAWVSSPRIL